MTPSEEKSLRERIEVSGAFGEAPQIKIDAPLELTESSSWIEEEGDGDTVGEDATAILELTLANGRTGKAAISTIDQGQPLEVKLGDQVFPSLNAALVGKPADSRIVVASVADDAYGDSGSPQSGIKGGDPVVMVADILSTDPTTALDGPTGETLAAPAKRAPAEGEGRRARPARLREGAQAEEAHGDPAAEGHRTSHREPGPDHGRLPRAGVGREEAVRVDLLQASRPSSPSGSVASSRPGTRPWTARRRVPG